MRTTSKSYGKIFRTTRSKTISITTVKNANDKINDGSAGSNKQIFAKANYERKTPANLNLMKIIQNKR